MAFKSIARVLVVDNDPRVGEDLQALLQPPEYSVEVVQGQGKALLDEAKSTARSFRPHVAVVDLRLLDEYSDERSGLSILSHLQSARCILYSAYLKPEVTSQASRKYGASDWVGKDEPPQRLLRAITEAAQESCAAHRNLVVHRPSEWTPQQVVSTLFGEGTDVPAEIVEDVLSQLFPQSRELKLGTVGGEITTPLPVSRGRSVVLKVQSGDFQPVVVKFAPAERIRSEAQNYHEHVRDRLVGRFYARLERNVEFWDLGGAVYTFLDSPLKTLHPFTSFYRNQTDDEVISQPLIHFFKEVWSRYYAHLLPEENVSLFDIYGQALRLKERLKALDNQEEKLIFPGLPAPLVNPVPWVLRHAGDSFMPEVYRAITHGDFHGDNFFVDGEHSWAIDFERTGPGHILRDFVELEVDIATRLVSFSEGKDGLSNFYEFAVVLAEPLEPTAPFRPTNRQLADSEIRKAFSVIATLRQLAHEMTHYSDSREYTWGLLLDALFVYTLASKDSPQRQRALLLAAALCDRLRHWGKDWSPIVDSMRNSSRRNTEKGANMLPPDQQAALMVLTEATKFLFSELGKKLDFWRKKKGENTPQSIEPKPEPAPPTIKLDDVERAINTEVLLQFGGRIETSLNILRKLTKELDGHRKQLLTDTLLDPKTRAWLENRIPELEELIEKEGERLQQLLEQVYGKRQ